MTCGPLGNLANTFGSWIYGKDDINNHDLSGCLRKRYPERHHIESVEIKGKKNANGKTDIELIVEVDKGKNIEITLVDKYPVGLQKNITLKATIKDGKAILKIEDLKNSKYSIDVRIDGKRGYGLKTNTLSTYAFNDNLLSGNSYNLEISHPL